MYVYVLFDSVFMKQLHSSNNLAMYMYNKLHAYMY